jgi:hypothetical protein
MTIYKNIFLNIFKILESNGLHNLISEFNYYYYYYYHHHHHHYHHHHLHRYHLRVQHIPKTLFIMVAISRNT